MRYGPGAFLEQVRGGDSIVLALNDPSGTFVSAPCAITIQVLRGSSGPAQILPGFWFDLNAIVVSGGNGLPSGGFELQLNAPLTITPGEFLAQGVALGPSPNFDPDSSWAVEVRIR